jgi:hypothetical protein
MKYPTTKELEAMANIDIRLVNKQELRDIRDVHIDENLTREERLSSFIEQIKNPYCYRCGDVVVKVNFTMEAGSMQEKMEQYLMNL